LTTQHFKTAIVQAGTRTVIPLPFDPAQVWGARQRYHITGTINGCAVRGPLDSDGTGYFLHVGAAWRRDNHLDAGAMVDVVLSPEGPQSELLADDLASALAGEPEARAFFDALPTFYRKNYMRWIDSAKRAPTRAARIAELVALLKAGKRER
jgi:Bacteriocin-protection, YdeI or OmpD-Associated/Domain of unknown function (DUF1905)